MRVSLSTLVLMGLPLVAHGIDICISGEYELIDASKRPASRNCETKGKVLRLSAVETIPETDSIDECVVLCKGAESREHTCTSFSYTAKTNTCVLYDKRLIDMGYRQKKKDLGTVFSSALCYQCKAETCNSEAVTNGDFSTPAAGDENGAADWTYTFPNSDSDNYIYRDYTFQSDQYITFVMSRQAVQEASISQVLPCTQEGRLYQLRFRTWGSGRATIGGRLDGEEIFSFNCEGSYCGDFDDAPHVSPPFLVTASTSTLQIFVEAAGDAEVTIDDVSFAMVPED